jgi:hypothetical protein
MRRMRGLAYRSPERAWRVWPARFEMRADTCGLAAADTDARRGFVRGASIATCSLASLAALVTIFTAASSDPAQLQRQLPARNP